MTDINPNAHDGWVSRETHPITPAEILFLWNEQVKRGGISVTLDNHGVLHFKAEEHPGVELDPFVYPIGDSPAEPV